MSGLKRIIFIPLSIIIFYLLSKSYVKYFDQISTGIHHLANGDFQSRVTITSQDEFQLIAEDINRAASKLQEAVEKGEFAENSKDQLVLNLAHDLRTPLTSVIGYLEYIMQHDEISKEVSTHYMSIAYSKSKRLEMLVEEMYPIFENQQLEARTNFPNHIPIHADGELLARVFENLLSNATRYGSDGKYIDIAGEVFDLVQQHGGNISVQSDITKTTFHIIIPKGSET